MKKTLFSITGMSCAGCARTIEKELENAPGVMSAGVNFPAERVVVEYDPQQTSPDQLRTLITTLGYRAEQIQSKYRQISGKISGMSCASCANTIEKSLTALSGVEEVRVNFAAEKITLTYDPVSVSQREIADHLAGQGYTLVLADTDEEQHDHTQAIFQRMLLASVSAGIIMALMVVHMFISIPGYFLITAVLAIPAVFIAGAETHRATWNGLTRKSVNMDTLITMGSLIPYLLSMIGFWFDITTFVEMAASIMALHLVGRYLEAKAKGRASQAIEKLLAMEAKTARVVREDVEQEIPVEEVRLGDIVRIKPGEKIPTDGEIISGETRIDESMATGESLPVHRITGDTVIGSTINQTGALDIRVTHERSETFLSRVIRMVEEAQGSKVPIQEFADRITGYFVPAVMIIAVTAFFSWLLFPEFHLSIVRFFDFPWSTTEVAPLTLAILAMTAVLVISCPCALGLATPTSLMVGSGMGAQRGILIRNGEAIQTMKDVNLIAFDKTGTLTRGTPEVTEVISTDEVTSQEILFAAASVERSSEHPLAGAILAAAKEHEIELVAPTSFSAQVGKGVTGEVAGHQISVGNRKIINFENLPENLRIRAASLEDEAKTVVFVSRDSRVIGILAISDAIKDDAKDAVEALARHGISTAMITGDNEKTARAVADQLGISHVIAEVLPGGKVSEIERLQEVHKTVAMVGDGINDAPALKQANVGIALGTGTDIAIEAGDITLVRGDVTAVVSAVILSRATFRKIRQNYFWAWVYNGVAIPAAFLGLLHPMIGAAAMAMSSLTVVLNSLGLRRISLKHT
ncbi:heavy metal translocating P-type ATPase [Chitinivibrio alkaliphilus]|uniref:P-type Cu(+) transporter n=1 Tax=Chitinivibrio alkaliphilus ACht1 TaxID=1313304 RepID=U7DEJ5_9BACT|nr:heavy metal translocating P-type ATPase [Chitinivibrio alkaliphilus]ERP39351.1 heavy metal translocating P-type ATPase [Chitinivibrio alkaliphilus ACht1]